MSDQRREFLQTIADNPNDDTPRLVMSDWLEEQGEVEHAELIRVQCEIGKITSTIQNGDMMILNPSPHRRILVSRESELLDTLDLDKSCYVVDRGFITSIDQSKSESTFHLWGNIFRENPVHTIRLREWRGLEIEIGSDAREVMWSLKRLEVPRSTRGYLLRSTAGEITHFVSGNGTCLPPNDYLPGVDVVFWNDSPRGWPVTDTISDGILLTNDDASDPRHPFHSSFMMGQRMAEEREQRILDAFLRDDK